MVTKRQRDSQRSKVYKAETAAGFDKHQPDPDLRDMPALVRFVRRVWRSKRLRAAWPKCGGDPPVVRDGRGHRNATGSAYRVTLPVWSRNRLVVLHELAHAVTHRQYGWATAGHGHEFCAVFLKLVLWHLGRDAHDRLKAGFKAHRVKFRPPRRAASTAPKGVMPPALKAWRDKQKEASCGDAGA